MATRRNIALRKHMTIALQDCRTGCYLDESGGWTNYVRDARGFQSSAEAMNARLRHRIAEAHLVFRFEREGYLIQVPLERIEAESSPELRAH
jgi:hypothetical protein